MNRDILICNLTRFGDLLQTQALINDLANSGYRIYLLCLENFRQATLLMENIHQVFALPASAILTDFSKNWIAGAADLYNFSQKIREQTEPTWIINLTPTLPARLLTKILSGKSTQILGFGMDNQGFAENLGIWASFISMAAKSRDFAPFNLAHMFRGLARPLVRELSDGGLKKPDKEAQKWASGFISNALSGKEKPAAFIAMQPGASSENRRWPVEHFAKLANLLWEKRKICVILTGSKQEEPLGERFAQYVKAPFVNSIGKTNLEQLAALLSQSNLLVTNDTGTMHLAAGLRVPVLAFFLATAQPFDTGPFLSGCCCLEPARDCHPCAFGSACQESCGAVISPYVVSDLILSFMDNREWKNGVTERTARECRVWQSRADDNGGIMLLPLSGQADAERTVWLNLMRDFWSQLFDSLRTGKTFPQNYGNALYPCDESAARVVQKAREIVQILIKQGEMLRVSAKSGQNFLKNCQNLQSVLDSNPKLGSIAAFWNEFQIHQGSDLNFFLGALRKFSQAFEWLQRQLEQAPLKLADQGADH